MIIFLRAVDLGIEHMLIRGCYRRGSNKGWGCRKSINKNNIQINNSNKNKNNRNNNIQINNNNIDNNYKIHHNHNNNSFIYTQCRQHSRLLSCHRLIRTTTTTTININLQMNINTKI